MTIKTDRLIISEISMEDLEDIHHLHSFKEIDQYNTLGIPKSIDETRKIILSAINDQKNNIRKEFCWLVREGRSGEVIGECGMFLSNDKYKMAEFYYKVNPKWWGKGYATEIGKALINFGFNQYKLHRIEAGVATENTRSVRVLEKLGMTGEGIRRKILPIRGDWVDNYHFAILEDDLRDY